MKFGLFILIVTFLFSGVLASPAHARPSRKKVNTPITVPFSGVLQDENLNPISGVFPIRFGLYKTASSRRAVWNERVWVAVDAGRYVVNIGARKPIPARLKVENLFVSVSMEGVGEILREPLVKESSKVFALPSATSGSAGTPTAAGPASSRSTSDIAERAMHAFEADHAVNADKIGNLSVSELQKMFAPAPVRVGSRTKESNTAGGPGGKLYDVECPKGYVVTGIRGGSGKYLDSISLICSPLEQSQ
jgi:hypothetical protein